MIKFLLFLKQSYEIQIIPSGITFNKHSGIITSIFLSHLLYEANNQCCQLSAFRTVFTAF